MGEQKRERHPRIQQAIDTMPAVLEPWGMLHLIEACSEIAYERDALEEEVKRLKRSWLATALRRRGGT